MELPFDPMTVLEAEGIETISHLWRAFEFIETIRDLRSAIGVLNKGGVLIMSHTAIKNLPAILLSHHELLADFDGRQVRQIKDMLADILDGERFSGIFLPHDKVVFLVEQINDRIRKYTRKSRSKHRQ